MVRKSSGITLFILINFLFLIDELKKIYSRIIFYKKKKITQNKKTNKKFINFNKYIFDENSKKNIVITSFLNIFEYLHFEYLVGVYLSNLQKKKVIALVEKKDSISKLYFEKLGINEIYYFEEPNLFIRYMNLINSYFLLNKIKSIDEFLKFKYKSIPVGQIIYSHYARYSGVPTINKIIPNFFTLFSTFLSYYAVFGKIIKNLNIDTAVQSEIQFMPGAVFLSQALKHKVNVFSRIGKDKVSLRKINRLNDIYMNRFHYDKQIVKKLNLSSHKNKLVKLGKNIVKRRFYGEQNLNDEIDLEYFKARRNRNVITHKKNNINIYKLFNWNKSKPIALVLANDLTDGIFERPKPLFKDNYVWLEQTLVEASKNTNFNWLIKPHPREIKNSVKLTTKSLMSKFDNFEHMKLLTQPLNSINLIKIIKVVFTSHGTGGYEYPIFGVASVNAAESIYTGLNIAQNPKNIFEYKKFIKNLHKNYKKLKFNRHNACLFSLLFTELGLIEFPSVKLKENLYNVYSDDYWYDLIKIYNEFEIKNNFDIKNDIFYKSLKYQLDKKKTHTIDIRYLEKYLKKY